MRILVVTQYYHPEPGATSYRLKSFVDGMLRRGHEVDVICEFPNHPTGVLAPGDRLRLFRIERRENVRIIRTFVLAFRKKNNITRMLFYLSFALSSFIAALLLKRHDIVLTSSPPIFHAFTAMIAARLKRSRFVLDIRDIWPDTALEVEAVTSGRLLSWGGYLERKLYKNAALIFAVSSGIKDTINSRGGAGKTDIVYNGALEDILNWKGDISQIRASLDWNGKFVVCYAGLIGLGQDLADLVPEIREVSAPDTIFVFVGDGPGKNALVNKAGEENLANVRFVDLMPRSEVIPLIHSADVMIVILREIDFFKSAIPSKFFDYMAAGKPVLTNVDGELRRILTEHEAGLYFSLRDPGSFANAVRMLKEHPDKISRLGENGKNAVRGKFRRSQLADGMVAKLERLFHEG